MHYGVRSANVVSDNAQFSTAIKEQQTVCGMFDHVALQSVRGRAGFGTFRNSMINRRSGYRSVIVVKIENPIYS
jgi:hypothetical protein